MAYNAPETRLVYKLYIYSMYYTKYKNSVLSKMFILLFMSTLKVNWCYNALRLGTVIVVSSGIDFVNTHLYSDRANHWRDFQFGTYGLCQREPKVPGLYKKHTATQPIMPEMRLEPLNVCLTDRHLNQLS